MVRCVTEYPHKPAQRPPPSRAPLQTPARGCNRLRFFPPPKDRMDRPLQSDDAFAQTRMIDQETIDFQLIAILATAATPT